MQTLAGHRLVRLLARGATSELWLGVQDAATAPVAIKLFHSATPLARLDSEVEALGRASHRHVQRLLDIATDAQGRTCLVLERLGVSLARVLADRGRLGAGEAVTVLAPVCDAVAELHRVGVAHGRVDAGSILLDETGAPVLARFGAATLVGEFPHPPKSSSLTPAEQAANGSLAADREALARLSELVLRQSDDADTVLAWVRRQATAPPELAGELAERLYALAPAAPLTIPSSPGRGEQAPLAIRPSRDLLETAPGEPAGPTDAAPSVPFQGLVPPWLDERISAWRDRFASEWLGDLSPRETILRMLGALKTVRPRVWVIAAGSAAALLLALLLTGTGHAPDAEVSTEPVSTEPALSAGASSLFEESQHRPAVLPTDPVEAARALLEHRERCFRELSVLCLDAVDQRSSAALDADRRGVIAAQQGSPTTGPTAGERIDWRGAELTLVDELGDGVLIQAAVPPATAAPTVGTAQSPSVSLMLLLVRTEEGWRIRDVFEWSPG